MKKTLEIFALVLTLVACSEFFPGKKDSGQPATPSERKPLPEKAEDDVTACAYGELPAGDLNQQFLWNVATKAVCPKVSEFRYNLTTLRLSARRVCSHPESVNAERDLNYHWYGAVAAFEYLVANPMEPLRANSGKLSMEIYTWPNDNKFAINSELLKAHEQGAAYAVNVAPTRKGLTAVEKLIFNKEVLLTPGVTGRLKPAEEAFNALPRPERLRVRCLVLTQMLNDVASQGEELYAEWNANEGQYPRKMLERLNGSAAQMLLSEISDGLFYLEKVKDYKLAYPLGLNARCTKERCPEAAEHALSGGAIVSLRANFDALKAALLGANGPGFLDLVRAVNRPDLANQMTALVERMEQTLAEVEKIGDFDQQIKAANKSLCVNTDSPDAVCRLYYLYKDFSKLYRTDFTTALQLSPPRTDSDND